MKKIARLRLIVSAQLALFLGLASVPFVARAVEDPLPKGPFPLGRPDLVEARTVKELRPGLTYVRVERRSLGSELPGKWRLRSPGGLDTIEWRSALETAGYSVTEQRSFNGWEEEHFLTAGEFDDVDDAIIASRSIAIAVSVDQAVGYPEWDTGPYVLNIVMLDPKVYKGKIINTWSGASWRASPKELAAQRGAVVATNGSLFEFSLEGINGVPTGISISEGVWHHEAQPRDHNAPILFWENGVEGPLKLWIDYDAPPMPELILGDGTRVTVDGIDRMPGVANVLHGGHPAGADELVAMQPAVFTSSILSHHIPPEVGVYRVSVDGFIGRSGPGPMLLATGSKREVLSKAEQAQMRAQLDLRVPGRPGLNATYVTPVLIKDGERTGTLSRRRLDRTFIGQDAVGRVYLMIAEHAGGLGPFGASLHELQDICEFLGLVNAAGLDGGGSSTSMVIEGQELGYEYSWPLRAWHHERRVGESILIIDDEE